MIKSDWHWKRLTIKELTIPPVIDFLYYDWYSFPCVIRMCILKRMRNVTVTISLCR